MNKKFTDQHEWILIEGVVATVGITDYAQQQLGDVVYVELPAVGRALNRGEAAAVVESVKAASDVYTPMSGVVMVVNEELKSNPDQINQSPEGQGWFFKIRLTQPEEVNNLMDADAYETLIKR